MEIQESHDSSLQLTEVDTETLMEALRREVELDKRAVRSFWRRMGFILATVIVLYLSMFWAIVTGTSGPWFVLQMFIYPAYISVALFTYLLTRRLGKRKAIKNQLIESLSQHPRAAGLLTQMVANRHQSGIVANLASDALEALLPRLHYEDAKWFNAEQMKALIGLMQRKDWRLSCAILKSLEQIGDSRALEDVERLAASSKQPMVQEMAQNCLPFLRLRSNQREKEATLLRPSAAESALPETLLRPATSTEITQAQETLLRPVD